jgi:hypothetical protein
MFKLQITPVRHNPRLKINYCLLSQPPHFTLLSTFKQCCGSESEPDLDPSDSYDFGSPESGSGSISQRYGSGYGYGSGSFNHHIKIVRKTLIPTVL